MSMAKTYTYRIWVAGDYADAVRALKAWCDTRGDCYAIAPCEYIYSGGSESGVCVTRIDYGRFPESEESISVKVRALASNLADQLFQKSYSIEGPELTEYHKRRGVWS